MNEILLGALRRRFKALEGAVPHAPCDFLHEFGDAISALLYAVVFVPEFVEIDGSVLLDGFSAHDRFLEAKSRNESSLATLESSFNFIKVSYLFSNRDSTDDEDRLLAEKIADAWRYRLKGLYPKQTFVVSVINPQVTGSVVGVHFFELR
jgi:hypothetical protein